MSKIVNYSNKTFSKILEVLFLLALCAFVVYYWYIILKPYPIEFREGHSMSSTTLLLNGVKPFTLDTYPEYYNSYGILFNLVVLPFVYLFGNSIVVYRVINELFYIGAILMILLYRREKKVDVITLVLSLNLYLFFHLNTNVSVRPDGLGVFLYSSVIVMALRNDFSWKYMILVGIMSLLAFYTKTYYFLCWYLVSLGLLFKGCKKMLLSNVLFHVLFFISLLVVNKIFPLYFYETVFAYGFSGDISSDVSDGYLTYSISQMLRSLKIVLPMLILAVIICLRFVANGRFFDLFKNPMLYMLLAVLIILVYPLGTNDGAYLTYHAQLMAPVFAIFVVENLDSTSRNSVALQMLLLVTVLYAIIFKIPIMKECDNSKEWNKLTAYIENSDNVLCSEPLSPILQIENRPVFDDGVSSFVYSFKPQSITTKLFGLDSCLVEKRNRYISDVKSGIKNGEYDLIITHDGRIVDKYIDYDIYKAIDSVDVYLPCNWPLKVYVYASN
ncbi:MAG: hypothetical protein Q4F69_00205 [Bacteroidia bacterium]|nr:hypothetical protein [Bacteroidia bacterium]